MINHILKLWVIHPSWSTIQPTFACAFIMMDHIPQFWVYGKLIHLIPKVLVSVNHYERYTQSLGVRPSWSTIYSSCGYTSIIINQIPKFCVYVHYDAQKSKFWYRSIMIHHRLKLWVYFHHDPPYNQPLGIRPSWWVIYPNFGYTSIVMNYYQKFGHTSLYTSSPYIPKVWVHRDPPDTEILGIRLSW